MTHWAHAYIGTRWTEAFNCWAFVRCVFFEQWRIRLPEIAESGNGNAHTIRAASDDTSMRPAPLDAAPQEGDLIIMRSPLRLHAGIVVVANGRIGVLHSTRDTGGVWQPFAEAIEGTTTQLWRRHD